MFENIKNVKELGFVEKDGSTLPVYELDDISITEWNEMAKKPADTLSDKTETGRRY